MSMKIQRSIPKEEMLNYRLQGYSYGEIAKLAGISNQRVQQLLSPPKAIRDIVIKKFNSKCADCGIFVGKSGNVHHQNGDSEDYNDLNNLFLLCPSCHRRRHYLNEKRFTSQQVAEQLGISRSRVNRIAKEHNFGFNTGGRMRMFSSWDVDHIKVFTRLLLVPLVV